MADTRRATSVMTALLCPANRCRQRGQHKTDCPGCNCPTATNGQHRPGHTECEGCLPRQAAPGLQLCWWHTDKISHDALTLAELHDDLTLALVHTGTAALNPNGNSHTDRGAETGININTAAVNVRHDIHNLLASWTKLIVEERGYHTPDTDNMTLARYIADNNTWLAARDYAGEVADELAALRGRAWRLLQPNSRHSFTIGACPYGDCGGTVIASMRPADTLLPPSVRCDTDPEHRWASHEWHHLRKVSA